MKKMQLGIVCLLMAGAALAEQMTLTGVLKFDSSRKYYSLASTPELASAIKGELFTNVNMEGISSGDQVKVVLDGAKVRPDGKISTWSATVVSVEKVQ